MKARAFPVPLQLALYAMCYGLVMVNGLDLVQAQGSQILPYMAWSENSSLFQNDLMGMTFPFYMGYSLWYSLAGWMAPYVPDTLVLYGYFILQCTLEVFGLWFLAIRLVPDSSSTIRWVLIILFTFGGALRHSLGSVAPMGWTVFPDTLATGILLFALGFLIELRFTPAFVLTAIAFNVHLSVTLLFCLAAGVVYLTHIREFPIKHTARIAAMCIVITVPLAIGILRNPIPGQSSDFSAWYSTIKAYQGMHSFPSMFGLTQYVPFLFWAILFILSIKRIARDNRFKTALLFSGATAGLLVISAVFTELIPVRTVITLSFFRGSRFLVIIFAFYSIDVFWRTSAAQPRLRKALVSSGSTLLVCFIAINLLVFHPVYRIYPQFVRNAFEYINQGDNPLRESLLFQTLRNSPEEIRAWKEIQEWCRVHTPPDRLVLTPYNLRGFRSYSQRGIVFQFRDANWHIYYPFMYDEIQRRSELIGAPFTEFSDETEYQVALEKRYTTLTDEEVKRLSAVFGCTHVVTMRSHRLDLHLEYENDLFSVYRISDKPPVRSE